MKNEEIVNQAMQQLLDMKLELEYPPPLKLQPGEQFDGIVITTDTGVSNKTGDPIDICTLRKDEDGSLWSLWISKGSMEGEFERNPSDPGDHITLKHAGMAVSRRNGQEYARWVLLVNREQQKPVGYRELMIQRGKLPAEGGSAPPAPATPSGAAPPDDDPGDPFAAEDPGADDGSYAAVTMKGQ